MEKTVRTSVVLEIEDGKVVSAPNNVHTRDATPEELLKLHESTFVTTLILDRQASTMGQCCYYIWIDGKWLFVCYP